MSTTAQPTDSNVEPSTDLRSRLTELLSSRILIMDGAMGTMAQKLGLEEPDYRGERFANHPKDLKGNHDILVFTRPDAITEIHLAYVERVVSGNETPEAKRVALDAFECLLFGICLRADDPAPLPPKRRKRSK